VEENFLTKKIFQQAEILRGGRKEGTSYVC